MNLSPRGLARTTARHPWLTIASWVVVLAVITVLAGVVGKVTAGQPDFTNNPDSKIGQHLLDTHFGKDQRAAEMIVFDAPGLTVDSPQFKATVDKTVANLAPWKGEINQITNYYQLKAAGAPQATGLVSQDRHSLLMPVTFNKDAADYSTSRAQDYLDQAEAASSNEVKVYSVGDLSGNATFTKVVNEDTSKDTSVGLPVAGVVLIVVFGALIAAFLPLVLGVIAIVATLGLVTILSHVLVVQDSTTILVTMIGLAVGIDYALFFLERFREERRHGAPKLDAIERAGGTAGKAVLFSGSTVILALLGLFIMPIDLFQGMAIGTGLTVVIAVAAALTLLPAVLRLVGDWINFPRFGIMRKLKTQDRTRVAQFATADTRGRGVWGHLATLVMRRPAIAAVATLAVLLVAAAPIFTMHIGSQSSDSLPASNYKSGYEVLAHQFNAGQDSPVNIVIEGNANSPAVKEQVAQLTAALAKDSRLGKATTTVSKDGQVTLVQAPTHADPLSDESMTLIKDLRSQTIPSIFGQHAKVYVAGDTAGNYDFDQTLVDHLPYVFAFVLGLSFLLLMIAFRSIVVPFVSILLNLLSVGAAYGLLVAVFQHGWGASLFGVTQVAVITNWLPVMLFCILFGLSMDYHVFLLSRIREHWDHSHDNEEAIAVGLQSTGRIITGAALIMVAVFAGFATGRLVDIQQFGFGLGVAVLLDATLIRTILVPATMKLIGRANWYMPRALHWLPNPKVEGDLAPVQLQRQPAMSESFAD